jgi:hypothetical protein
VEHEGLSVVFHKSDIYVSVTPRFHVAHNSFVDGYFRSKHLPTLTHAEHWEMILVLIVFLMDVLNQHLEGVMILSIAK